jgi:predicted ester cyclase
MAGGKAVVQRMFGEVINNKQVGLIDELFDPTYISHTQQGDLDREGFKGFVQGWIDAFPDLHTEVSHLIEEGDNVSWMIRATGTMKGDFNGMPASGKSMDFLSLNHGVMRDGKAVEHWVIMDMITMLTQLGFMPPQG